jgi:hypothetical protein
MPSVVNLRPHEPTAPRRTSAQARQRGRPSRLCPRIDPREGRRADARATAEGLTNSLKTAIGDTQQTPQQLRFVSGCSIRVADGNSRSLPYGPTRGGPWMWRLEAIQASSHDALDGVAPTVRNSHQTNPRLPSKAELIMLGVIGTPRRNVLGAIAMKRTIATSRCNDNRDEFHYEPTSSPTISSTRKAKHAQRYQCATPSIETSLA